MKRVVDGLLTLLLLGMVLFLSENMYAGRGDKAGTSAAPELLIPVGGRDIAMGGASLALTSGVDAIYWNPAGLSRTTNSAEALFSHMKYIADIGVDYVAVGVAFEGFGNLGLSLKSLSFGDIEITTADVPEGTGQKFSPTYVTLGLTYSRLLTDRISVGVTTNLITERIDRVSATGVAFNFGVQYSSFANVSGLSIGVAVKNIGGSMTFAGAGLLREATATDNLRPPSFYTIQAQSDELPSTIELGVAYQHKLEEQHVLTLSTVFQNNNMSDDEYKLGAEYGFDNTLFLRGGYDLMQESRPDTRVFGATFGAGVHYTLGGMDFTVDYAYRAVKYLDANHIFSLKLGF
jgi:hypothetical protein